MASALTIGALGWLGLVALYTVETHEAELCALLARLALRVAIRLGAHAESVRSARGSEDVP